MLVAITTLTAPIIDPFLDWDWQGKKESDDK